MTQTEPSDTYNWMIAVDWENTGETFWESADAAKASAPEFAQEWLASTGSKPLYVTAEQAQAVLDWASQLDGWEDDSAQYAQYPIMIQRVAA